MWTPEKGQPRHAAYAPQQQSAPALARLLDEVERLAGGHPEMLEVRALRVELARLGLFLWNPDFYALSPKPGVQTRRRTIRK